MTSTWVASQPSFLASSTRAYWRSVDSRCSWTCNRVDWRMYTSAGLARCSGRILVLIACLAFRGSLGEGLEQHVGQHAQQLVPGRRGECDVERAQRWPTVGASRPT